MWAIMMTVKATAIFVSVAILQVCRKFLSLKWNKVRSNIIFIKSLRINEGIRWLGSSIDKQR